MEVTLDELLQSRDLRHQKHLELLDQFHDHTLVSVTMVMPGTVKSNFISISLADKAENFLRHCDKLQIEYLLRLDKHTGSEIFFISKLPLEETKRLCCAIEDGHPLGRLWDFDVIKKDSTPMSRTELGVRPRKCIICDEDAIYCIRGRKHSKEDLYQRVKEIFEQNQYCSDSYEL